MKSPLHVCSFESRRATEMASLIERHGGKATLAPSMQEVALTDNVEALRFAELIFAGEFDIVVFLTGVGATALCDAICTKHDQQKFLDHLDQLTTIVRGPKPHAVLRDWKVHIDHRAQEPNTWREIVEIMDQHLDVNGSRIAIQEYGIVNHDLHKALQSRGAETTSVPIYRWALPDDTGPLESAIRSTCDRQFDLLLFTSAQQVRHVFEVAETMGLRDKWLALASKTTIGSIGPTTTDALAEYGLTADMEPSHPKMAHLVREAVAVANKKTGGISGESSP